MERIIKIFSKEFNNINQAALVLGGFAFLSQILGLFRDRAIAHFIGPGALLDSYYAAFRIPDLIFISIASLASITVLIPFIAKKMSGDIVTKEAEEYLNNIFSVFLVAIFLVSVLVFFLMPYLVHFIAPGFDAEMKTKVIELSRIMLLSPIFLGLSNLFGTITQLFRRFFFYSLSPLFYNLGIIFGVIILYPILGIYGLALGVSVGALMHFLIQYFASFGCGFRPRLLLSNFNLKEIKETVYISLPRTLGLSLNNIALIVIVALASFLKTGSISIFNFSLNLQNVTLGIVGLSYSVAVFPVLVKSFSSNDLDSFKNHLKSTARQIIFWSLPISFLFIVLRAQIVRVILGTGSFSWNNTRLVAASLAMFALSMVAQGLISLFARTYYAAGNTKKPLFINLISSTSIVVFSFVLLYVFEKYEMFRFFIESLFRVSDIAGTEILMLPLAYSLGTILNFTILWFHIKKDFMQKESFLSKAFLQSLGASFFLGIVSYFGLNIFSPIFGIQTFWGIFLQGFLSGILGILSAILILHLLKNEELKALFFALKTKFEGNKIIKNTEEIV